jgi:YVTN family beta-propeller protein
MAQVVRSRLFRSAMRAATAVDVAGLAAVVSTPVGAPQTAGLAILHVDVDNGRSGTVSVINTSTNKVVKMVGLAAGDSGSPTRGAITTDLN